MRKLFSRRDVLWAGLVAGAGTAIARRAVSASISNAEPIVLKTIPSSGEQLPVIGLGTNAYGVSDREALAARREVLQHMAASGATLIDTAPSYGESEAVLGTLMAESSLRGRFFVATKITAGAGEKSPGQAMFERSLKRLRTDQVDLLQVHNLDGIDVLMPVLKEWKAARRIRYHGATTSRGSQHTELFEVMRRHPLDFIQVNYSLGDRAAADRILPFAMERGIAVLLNLPFGGRRGSLFRETDGKVLPSIAADLGIRSWGQFFLKYAVSHPAVTSAIPGTTQVSHFDDNIGAARGPQPDTAQRKEMEKIWDAMTA